MNVLILMDLQDGARPIRGTALSVPATHRACYSLPLYALWPPCGLVVVSRKTSGSCMSGVKKESQDDSRTPVKSMKESLVVPSSTSRVVEKGFVRCSCKPED